ncbi:MAG: DoxX family protein [Planctomycetota bacterium]
MEAAFETVRLLSIVAFLFFGAACLLADRMVAEFERYGLARFRRLVGALEILGALGLIGSYRFDELVLVSAGGLAALMMLGVVTRVRIQDSLLETLPAAALCAMNAFLVVRVLG